MEGLEITEEKVRKLMPIIEGILSRRLGKKFVLNNLTVGGVTASKKSCAK